MLQDIHVMIEDIHKHRQRRSENSSSRSINQGRGTIDDDSSWIMKMHMERELTLTKIQSPAAPKNSEPTPKLGYGSVDFSIGPL